MKEGWPYPGDSPVRIARACTQSYRQRLLEVAPDACAEEDAKMRRLGQHWAVPRLVNVDPDDWLTPAEAAELAYYKDTDSIGAARRRGRLKGREISPGVWEYQAREVMKLSTHKRRRGRSQGEAEGRGKNTED